MAVDCNLGVELDPDLYETKAVGRGFGRPGSVTKPVELSPEIKRSQQRASEYLAHPMKEEAPVFQE